MSKQEASYRVLSLPVSAEKLETELNALAEQGYRVVPIVLCGGTIIVLEHQSIRDAVGAKLTDMMEGMMQMFPTASRKPAEVLRLARPATPALDLYVAMMRSAIEPRPGGPLSAEELKATQDELARLWEAMSQAERDQAERVFGPQAVPPAG